MHRFLERDDGVTMASSIKECYVLIGADLALHH
jgi:hypothetical protein